MARHPRRIAAVLVFVGASIALSVVLGIASKDGPSAAKTRTGLLVHESVLEHGQGGTEEADGAAAEAYAERAYPASEITPAETRGAIAANAKLQKKGPKFPDLKWDQIGPDTLNVDRLGTQSFIKPTQWSGRITAVTAGTTCATGNCPLYIGAAGGGVWRTKDATAKFPKWDQISGGIPTNAIGSIAVDPNDSTGRTIYVGTGEGNGSGDSEAGLGLFKSTDEGKNWSLVPGSTAAANNRSITWVAIEPGNANHILIGTRSGTHGEASNSTAAGPPNTPPVGVWASSDGGASFGAAPVLAGSINEVKFDPGNSSTVYATLANVTAGGLLRSASGGAAGSWEPIFQENRARLSFAAVTLPNGKTRIYLSDASGTTGPTGLPRGAQVYRIDDASQAAATLTAPCSGTTVTCGNAAWTRLSNPTDGTPGFAVYNYCNTPLVGSQCGYDMFVMSPPERPDMVVVGGLMHYEELRPYVFQAATPVGVRSNGRAVLMSMDAGATWTDMTGDVGGESMHPDQHALAFAPGNPDQFFVGSDGGLIRTNGSWADASAQCDNRHIEDINPAFITECKQWLSKIPEKLEVMNAGLATLQMNSISVSPYKPENTAMTGTQDNGTLAYTGNNTWILPLTGDGGNSGFDATDPHFRFHTYTGGQMDVNYNDFDPNTWLFIGDRFLVNFPEGQRFYAAVVSDPLHSKTIFHGAQSVWRTSNGGGDRAFLEAHCNVASIIGEDPNNLLFTGACGTPADWPKLGTSTLTNNTATSPYGTTKGGSTISSLARAQDDGTMWAATGAGRLLISRNINAADPASVTFTRLDGPLQPGRAIASVTADPTNPNHAIVTYSGYNVTTLATPGHIFDVTVDPGTGLATWKDISYDIGDQPVNDSVIDTDTGGIYVSTDFSVFRLQPGSESWTPVATGLPMAAVSGLTLAKATHGPNRFIYAATHGRGAYRLTLRPGPH